MLLYPLKQGHLGLIALEVFSAGSRSLEEVNLRLEYVRTRLSLSFLAAKGDFTFSKLN